MRPEDLPHILSQAFFKGKVMTESMVPVIKVNDSILVKVKDRDLKRFDIIVFWDGQKMIAHYLWYFNKFITPFLLQTRNIKGVADFPVGEDQYIGKVLSHRLNLWQKLKILFF